MDKLSSGGNFGTPNAGNLGRDAQNLCCCCLCLHLLTFCCVLNVKGIQTVVVVVVGIRKEGVVNCDNRICDRNSEVDGDDTIRARGGGSGLYGTERKELGI